MVREKTAKTKFFHSWQKIMISLPNYAVVLMHSTIISPLWVKSLLSLDQYSTYFGSEFLLFGCPNRS